VYLLGSDILLPVLASTVILSCEPRGAHDHILLSQDSGSRATVCLCTPRNLLVFYTVRVVSEDSRALVLSRSSCISMI
jgi:hypothetical protein